MNREGPTFVDTNSANTAEHSPSSDPSSSESGFEQEGQESGPAQIEEKRLNIKDEEFTLLDPDQISLRRFHRTERALDPESDPEFHNLVNDIYARGGNTQPIYVRNKSEKGASDSAPYELVFGRRRLEACRRNQLQVRAIITDIDEGTALKEFIRENHSRQDVSPYELAHQYKELIDQGYAKERQEVAALLDINKGTVTRTMQLLDLPENFWELFPDVRLVRQNRGAQVYKAWKQDPEALKNYINQNKDQLKRAAEEEGVNAVIDQLTAAAANTSSRERKYDISDKEGNTLFSVSQGKRKVQLSLPTELWDSDVEESLQQWLEVKRKEVAQAVDHNEEASHNETQEESSQESDQQ